MVTQKTPHKTRLKPIDKALSNSFFMYRYYSTMLNTIRRFKSLINSNKLILSRNALIFDKRIYSDMQTYWGQHAEDAIIRIFLPNTTDGFYVDVGAFHPTRYSNTYSFYLDGWTGINIDPSIDSINSFNAVRPRDVNINVGVADESGTLQYYRFEEGAFNTFDPTIACNWKEHSRPLPTETIRVERLESILQLHLNERQIDFLTIDVEGLELSVLQSNDWLQYRPRLIVMEVHGRLPVDEYTGLTVIKYLKELNYVFVGIVGHSTYFLSHEEYSTYSAK